MAAFFHTRCVRITIIWLLLMNLVSSTATLNESLLTPITAFSVNTTDARILCWYPISGNYGRLPRILFYCTIVFGLLASQNEWLVAGALACALTYSGTAAIHTCILYWRGPTYGELDYQALIAILSTSGIVIVPLLNWSDTLRHLGSRDGRETGTRTLILYWGFLVTVGLATIFSQLNSDSSGINASSMDSIACVPQGSQINCTAGQDLSWHNLHVDTEWVQANGCNDPCQARVLYPAAIFRSSADLQLLSQYEISVVYDASKPFWWTYAEFGVAVGVFILLQGAWAALFGRQRPHQHRDTVYSFLKNTRLPIPKYLRGAPVRISGRWRRHTAKYIAIAVYLWAVIASALCVILFFINIVVMEYSLWRLPQSESAIHVGAWSPWVNTALLISAAFIAKFHPSLVSSMSVTGRQAVNQINHFIHRGAKGIKREKTESDTSTLLRLLRDLSRLVHYLVETIRQPTLGSLGFIKGRLSGGMSAMREEWVSLKEFWRDPDEAVEATKT